MSSMISIMRYPTPFENIKLGLQPTNLVNDRKDRPIIASRFILNVLNESFAVQLHHHLGSIQFFSKAIIQEVREVSNVSQHCQKA